MSILKLEAQTDEAFIAECARIWREEKRISLEAQEIADNAKERADIARANLIFACDSQPYEGNFVKVTLIERKGLVDYSQIPELKGVDLDQYRKEKTTHWDVKPSVKE